MATLLAAVERGQYPPPDGRLTLLAPNPTEPGRAPDAAVLSFTGHVIVIADVTPAWLSRQLIPGELSEAFTPPFLAAIATELGRRVNAIDLVALAAPLAGDPPLPLTPITDLDHPRVRRARRYRADVSVWTADGGVLVLGRGLGGRWEVAIEVDEDRRGCGLGRRLATAARHLIRPTVAEAAAGREGRPGVAEARPGVAGARPGVAEAGPGRGLWAQVAPGNAASVRAFLAAGFRPVGQEALLVDH